MGVSQRDPRPDDLTSRKADFWELLGFRSTALQTQVLKQLRHHR